MNILEYLDNVPEERRSAIQQIHDLIKGVYPDIEVNMTYRMPTYILKGETLCALANQKNYMALYIMPHDLLAKFAVELKPYNMGKSCIRFKQLRSDSLPLFRKIIQFCGDNYPRSNFYGKMNAKK